MAGQEGRADERRTHQLVGVPGEGVGGLDAGQEVPVPGAEDQRPAPGAVDVEPQTVPRADLGDL